MLSLAAEEASKAPKTSRKYDGFGMKAAGLGSLGLDKLYGFGTAGWHQKADFLQPLVFSMQIENCSAVFK